MALNGVVGLSAEHSPENRVKLLRTGISPLIMVDGQAVLSSLVTSKGTSAWTTRWAGQAIDIIEDIEQRLATPAGVSEIAAQLRFSKMDPAMLCWELNHCDLRLRYPPTETALLLLRWRR